MSADFLRGAAARIRLAVRGGWSIARALVVIAPLTLSGCDWFTTFEQQPKVEPWEAEFRSDSIAWLMGDTIPFRANPQMSVPVTGMTVPGFAVSYGNLPGVIDSMSGLRNPVLPDARSLDNGRKYYTINCAVCHGPAGAGNGPATRYGMFPIPLIGDATKGRSDGYIWGIIRNGRGSMPPYNRIEEMDRWDVVNYVRGLQGMLATRVDTGAVAMPGVGGSAVPGFTELAPTRSSPWRSTVPPGRSTSDPTRTTGVLPPTPAQPVDSAARAPEAQP